MTSGGRIGLLRGRPKKEETKANMSKAKLGVEKSDDHKAAMARAHTLRHLRARYFMDLKNIEFYDALGYLKEEKMKLMEIYLSRGLSMAAARKEYHDFLESYAARVEKTLIAA
jgi:hypothetical protein